MKSILLFLLTITSFAMNAKTIDTLRDFQWENRLLLVHLSNPQAYDSLMSKLTGVHTELADRKLVVAATYNDELSILYSESKLVTTHSLKEQILRETQNQPNTLFLIGLDGGTKAKYPIQGLEMSEIFGRIDSMPMRAAEIRSRQAN